MGHCSAVGFLAFSLCLVACVSASATVEIAEEDQAPVYTIYLAKKAVEDAIKSIKEVSDKAQGNINNATVLLQKVEKFKTEAEESQSKAVEVEQNNKGAADNVNKIKTTFNEVSKLHQGAKEKLEKTISSLRILLEEAEKVKGECDTELLLIKEAAEEYKDTKKKVPDLKKKAGLLETNITNILTNMNGVQSTAGKMEKHLKETQLANLHVNVIFAVEKIEKMIKEVDSHIKETEKKKDEVNVIVEEMKKHCTTPYAESNTIIKPLCDSANDAFTSAIGAVEESKKAKGDIEKQKDPANTALQNFQGEKTLTEASDEVTKAKECVVKVKDIADQLQIAEETAKNAVANAKELQKKLETALSTTTTAPSREQNTERKKSVPSVGEGTGLAPKDATIQTKITGTEQPTSKDSLAQSNNSTDKLKDALIKGAQNVPTTALTGGKAPAPGAKNDSAMTVSLPLLVALIASAVLQ